MAPFPPLESNKPTEEINYSSKHISAAKRDITVKEDLWFSLFLGLVTFKQIKYVIKKETLVPEVNTTQSVGHHL